MCGKVTLTSMLHLPVSRQSYRREYWKVAVIFGACLETGIAYFETSFLPLSLALIVSLYSVLLQAWAHHEGLLGTADSRARASKLYQDCVDINPDNVHCWQVSGSWRFLITWIIH